MFDVIVKEVWIHNGQAQDGVLHNSISLLGRKVFAIIQDNYVNVGMIRYQPRKY